MLYNYIVINKTAYILDVRGFRLFSSYIRQKYYPNMLAMWFVACFLISSE